ncbi:hypothetical protein PsorP6_001733 [Peronosclerospora sorghi]|uniref:Uncharacterized protein n=1 Tax=Peronosclerospora sorghi TaxID=230839 RepID=A0ACC0WTD5_9STRA|nr:hypothetical protein PsorP6_001733 [Peronosclerospora sorghi]
MRPSSVKCAFRHARCLCLAPPSVFSRSWLYSWTHLRRELGLSRDRERNIGHLSCRVCTESFQTSIHCTHATHTSRWLDGGDLSAPIDVYTDWIDECEALNA